MPIRAGRYLAPLMFGRWLSLSILVVLSCFSGGCSSAPRRHLSAEEDAARHHKVWLVSNRFHTSIAVEAETAPDAVRKLDPKANVFVIGWGGKEMYMLREVKPWQWVTCLVLPTSSALHVIPIRGSLVEACPNSDIIEFETSQRGRDRLQKRLRRAFARDRNGGALVVGPGKIDESRFFAGTEIYHLPKTCNLWAAASLKAADIPIYVSPALAANNLLWQGRKHGRVIGTYREPGDKL